VELQEHQYAELHAAIGRLDHLFAIPQGGTLKRFVVEALEGPGDRALSF
jgi:hypothetical protein